MSTECRLYFHNIFMNSSLYYKMTDLVVLLLYLSISLEGCAAMNFEKVLLILLQVAY